MGSRLFGHLILKKQDGFVSVIMTDKQGESYPSDGSIESFGVKLHQAQLEGFQVAGFESPSLAPEGRVSSFIRNPGFRANANSRCLVALQLSSRAGPSRINLPQDVDSNRLLPLKSPWMQLPNSELLLTLGHCRKLTKKGAYT